MALSINPSEFWAGNDGSWSTFDVLVGTPPQVMQVLPATSKSTAFVVLSQGCTNLNGTGISAEACASSRGGIFDPGPSEDSTWFSQTPLDGQSYFQLPYASEQHGPNYNATGELGTDVVLLEWHWTKKHPPPPVTGQYVTGYAAPASWLGMLGLSGWPTDIFNKTSFQPSFLQTLKDEKIIPSLYWAYTAGASYIDPPTFGSLTLGGYDAARTNTSQTLTVPFGADQDLDLMVAITSISFTVNSTTTPVSTPDTFALIDSVVPELWLPATVCDHFEKIYGLVWNDTLEIYLVSEDQHAAMVANDPSVTFFLATGAGGSSGTSITLPYNAFDLNVSFPLANIRDTSELRYFPLKRATPSNNYLGRTFLQHAYVTANYETTDKVDRVFTVSPALFPDGPSAQKLRTVYPPGHHVGLSAGAIAGIAVGAAALVALVGGLLFWLWRRRKAQARVKDETGTMRTGSLGNTTVFGDTEMDEWQQREYFKPIPKIDPSDQFAKQELDANGTATGPVGQLTERHELDAGSVRPTQHRHGLSWGSNESGVSSMTDERIRSAIGEPSPPIYQSRTSSPPMSGGRRHSRHHSAGSPRGLFEMQGSSFELQGSAVMGRSDGRSPMDRWG